MQGRVYVYETGLGIHGINDENEEDDDNNNIVIYVMRLDSTRFELSFPKQFGIMAFVRYC